MKLYYSPGACSLAPHLVIKELKLPVEMVRVDLKAKTFVGGDYKTINPRGSVPVLQLDNGETLTEAAVILQYLADQKPEAGLLPKAGSWERVRCQEWLNFVATELHKGFGPLWRANTPEDYKPIVLQNLARQFGPVNARLEKNDYLMGKNYSVADAYLYTVVKWSYPLKVDLSEWPHLQKFMDRVRARPATQEAFTVEGLK